MRVSISNLRAKADFRAIISGRARERRERLAKLAANARSLSRELHVIGIYYTLSRNVHSKFVRPKEVPLLPEQKPIPIVRLPSSNPPEIFPEREFGIQVRASERARSSLEAAAL